MDDDQQFCLRWNNHQSTLVAVFDTLLENDKLVDCTLAAEGKFLNAHKVVLSACSPYFEALLSRHYDKHPILILKDVKFQELKAMMDYMYRGEVNISQDQLGALLKAAESLQIKGLSDNKKDEGPVKRPAPAPAPPKSPQTQTQLPKVQGLTIEQRSRDDREGSMSPGPRKKKRMRRKSEEIENHHDASNSSDAHSLPPQNIPSVNANIKMNSDLSDNIDPKQEIISRHKDDSAPQVPMIKEKLETHTELMLEPKSEYVEEMNEDSVEDLTLDDDDLSNMEQMDDGAGPSHGGDGSAQGFGHWQMGNQSQDEVFLAAQEAVGAHRDSQGFAGREQYKRQYLTVQRPQRPSAPLYGYQKRNIEVLGLRRPQIAAQRGPNLQRRIQLSSHMIKPQVERIVLRQPPKTTQNVVQQHRVQVQRPQPVKPIRRSAEPQVTIERSAEPKMFKPIEPTKQTEFKRAWSVESEAPALPETQRHKPVVAQFKMPAEIKPVRLVEDHSRAKPAKKAPKISPMKGSGLLTDSLSVIFTRRNNQQWKPAQNRAFYKEQTHSSELDKKIDADDSDTESICVDCPAPPRISQPTPQPTPDISTEDWFTTKQRILGNVKIDQDICEPMKLPTASSPDSKNIQVDPHGFDIEPPTHMNQNVSPYVPSVSFERDEYEKYKTEKLKKEITLALLHQRYEAAKQAQKKKDNREREQLIEEENYREEENQKARQEYDRGNLADQSYEEDQDDQDLEKYHIEKEALNIQATEHHQPQYDYQQQTFNDPNYAGSAEQYQNEQVRYYEQQYESQNYEHQQNYAEDYQYQQAGETIVAPEAPQISQEHHPQSDVQNISQNANAQYYQAGTYQEYVKYDETNTFKEPQPVSSCNQTMCHKCSFQTTNPKKLKDHLKFVHGEVVSVEPASHAGDLYFRREPKMPEGQADLFSRRGDFPAGKKPVQKFKRRNTANLVHIISDVVVPTSTETPVEKEGGMESSGSKAEESGVTAALEYFESNKDQPKKPRPYKRDPDQMDKEWI